jgi:hypothetical protein
MGHLRRRAPAAASPQRETAKRRQEESGRPLCWDLVVLLTNLYSVREYGSTPESSHHPGASGLWDARSSSSPEGDEVEGEGESRGGARARGTSGKVSIGLQSRWDGGGRCPDLVDPPAARLGNNEFRFQSTGRESGGKRAEVDDLREYTTRSVLGLITVLSHPARVISSTLYLRVSRFSGHHSFDYDVLGSLGGADDAGDPSSSQMLVGPTLAPSKAVPW